MQSGGPLGPPEQHYRLIRDAGMAEGLLEALEAAMDYIDKCPCDPDIHEDQLRAWWRLQDLTPRSVIAKAHGEAQDGR